MPMILLEQEIVFSFTRDKSRVGVGGFMRAASGTKSIKDSEPGPWTEVGGQGYWQQLAVREVHQTFSNNRLNLFALSFIHSTPHPPNCLISCIYLHPLPDFPRLSLACFTLPCYLETFLDVPCPRLCLPPISHCNNLDAFEIRGLF